jgi:hypothetical protein
MARPGNDLVLGDHPDGRPIMLAHDARLEHTCIVGTTGSGKSRFVENMLRQDLRNWPKTRCGLMLIDPHGDVYDGILSWIAANGLHHLPIVPIDLRRSDRIISYNVLRRRIADPAVIIDSFVKAIANVFGQPGTDQTPLLERWLTNILYLLYHQHKTLADIAYFLTPDNDIAIDAIDDLMVRRDWVMAKRYRKEFDRDTQSLINRVRRFVLNPMVRAMFGQTDVSLDLGRVLDEGQIVLVSLGRARGQVSQENSDLFATLLVSDFWMAAEERGIAESIRPFYLYLDEFQRFVTPAMAASLAESRKFGVGLTLANQFPRQVFNAGPHGPQIYDEIRENARTKISFRLRSPENLELVANEMFLSTFNPWQRKYQHQSTKVLGHRVEYLPSYGKSTTATTGGGTSSSHTHGRTHTVGSQWSHTETEGNALTHSSTATVGVSTTDGTERSDSVGHTNSSVESGGHSTAASRSHGKTVNASVNESMGISGQNVLPKDADGNGGAGFQDHADADGTDQTWNRGVSDGSGISDTAGTTETQTTGWNKATSRNAGTSLGRSHATSLSESCSDGIAETATASVSETVGGSESFAVSESETVGENSNWSDAKSQSVNLAPVVFSVLGKEAEQPVFLSIDDQRILAMQKIFRLRNREAFVLTSDMDIPVFIRSPQVTRPDLSRVVVAMAAGWYQRQSGLTLPLDAAIKRVRDRDREWESGGALAAADEDFAPVDTKPTVMMVKRVERK